MNPTELLGVMRTTKGKALAAASRAIEILQGSDSYSLVDNDPQVLGEIATHVRCSDLEELARTATRTETNADAAGFDHSRAVELVNDESSAVICRDEITTRNGRELSFRIVWVFDGLIELVTHGHGVEVFRGGVKIADMIFEANVAVSTKLYGEVAGPEWHRAGFTPIDHNAQKSTVVIQLRGASVSIESRFSTVDFNYLDRGLLASSEPWSRFVSSVALNFLFRPASTMAGQKVLVIAFSSIHKPGVFGYNYKAAIDPIGTNTLFILDDFGDQGAYYLMDRKDSSIFESVQHLITEIVNDLGLDRSNVVTIGSSKGGTAAIMHGISAGVGHVFVGAPQTRIGTFLAKPHPNVLEFMSGQSGDQAVEFLDRQMFDQIRNAYSLPRIGVVVGSEDHHYKRHVLPLAEHMKALGLDLELEVLPGVPHAKIGPAYRSRLLNYIQKVVDGE